MSAQLEFGGTVPFQDRSTGQQIPVRVWGVYQGHGVDAHEEQAIRDWIMNALTQSAAAYDGNVHELPQKAQEWGAWVSQQIAPAFQQQFQAQGQLLIHGVQIEGAGGGYPDKKAAMGGGKGAMMAGAGMAAGGMGAGMAQGGGVLNEAAHALTQQLGMPYEQAQKAAQVVLQVAGVGGGMAAGGYAQKGGHDPYAAKQDPGGYPQKGGHDPYAAKKDPGGYPQKGGHDPYAAKQDPGGYPQKGVDPYAAKKDPGGYPQKGGDPYAAKKDPYGKKGG